MRRAARAALIRLRIYNLSFMEHFALMDKKGITVFILVTFGIGYALQLLLGWFGLIDLSEPNIFQRLLLLALLFVPALGALCARPFSQDMASNTMPRLWPIPRRAAIQTMLTLPLAFVIIHLLLTLTGIQEPQWRMGTLMNNINATLAELQQPPMSDTVATIAPIVLLIAGFALSIVLGATLYAVVALGMEWAWRGYLLPRLMPLGKVKAYTVVGVLSGLWFLPLFVLYYREGHLYGSPWLGGFQFILAAIALGMLSGELFRRSGNLGLSCIAIGAFLGQVMGIWPYLFPVATPPWSGPIGLMALLVWAVLAWKPTWVAGPLPHADSDSDAAQSPQKAVSNETV